MTVVLSLRAEGATQLIMSTLAQHRRQEALLAQHWSVPGGRLRRLSMPSASAEVRRQSTLFRMVSITESHVSGIVSGSLDHEFPAQLSGLAEHVVTSARDSITSAWPKMVEHLKKWHGLKFSASECPSWTRIEATVTARNAIAHGVGHLTPRMSRGNRSQLESSLALVNMSLIGDQLVVPERALQTISGAQREFVAWLDEKLAGGP
jgi:hypothetical protein